MNCDTVSYTVSKSVEITLLGTQYHVQNPRASDGLLKVSEVRVIGSSSIWKQIIIPVVKSG